MAKVNLKKEAEVTNDVEVDNQITDTLLRELCPPSVTTRFKAAKTPAQRADLLYALDKGDLKVLRAAFKEMDTFVSKLEQWFIQELSDDQRGVTGKTARVEVKSKEIATVEDWPKFYAHIAKKKEFDLLNKAVNQKSVQERWENHKEIPGVGKFVKRVISLTAAKE